MWAHSADTFPFSFSEKERVMGRQSCQVQFSTVSAGTLTQHAQECPFKSGCSPLDRKMRVQKVKSNGVSFIGALCLCTGQLSFAIGDLRGGAATPLQSLKSSIRNQRRLQVPTYELSKARGHDKVEKQHRIVKIQGDGRCMFRALVSSLHRLWRKHSSRLPCSC